MGIDGSQFTLMLHPTVVMVHSGVRCNFGVIFNLQMSTLHVSSGSQWQVVAFLAMIMYQLKMSDRNVFTHFRHVV